MTATLPDDEKAIAEAAQALDTGIDPHALAAILAADQYDPTDLPWWAFTRRRRRLRELSAAYARLLVHCAQARREPLSVDLREHPPPPADHDPCDDYPLGRRGGRAFWFEGRTETLRQVAS